MAAPMTFNAPGGNIFGGPNAAAPAGGGKGGAMGAQPMQRPAQPMQQPTQPNVFQQSSGALTGAIQGTQGAMNYDPRMITPATLGKRNLDQYMNPFQQSVIDATMRQSNRQQAMDINNLDAAAGAAGAFGGSRHGVAMGETNRGYADAQAQTLAGLNSANFGQAQQGAMYDANILNANRQFNAGQRNNDAMMNLQAAGQLGNLSNLGFGQGMQINNQQNAQGAQQQALQQMLMNAAQGQFGGFTGAPGQSLQQLLGGVGGVPYGTSGSQTQTNNPGLFDWLSLGLSF